MIGAVTGWFLFEEIITGAIIFVILGVVVWLGHQRKKRKKNFKKSI